MYITHAYGSSRLVQNNIICFESAAATPLWQCELLAVLRTVSVVLAAAVAFIAAVALNAAVVSTAAVGSTATVVLAAAVVLTAVVVFTVADVFNTVADVFYTVAVVLCAVVRLPKNTFVLTKNQNLLNLKAFELQIFKLPKVISLFRRSGCTLKNPK